MRNSAIQLATRALQVLLEGLFRDPIRPVEVLSLAFLASWAEFMLRVPEAFDQPLYAAFGAFPPFMWAVIFALIGSIQIASFFPLRDMETIRFIAMALQGSIWALVAFSFWSSGGTPISARTYTSLAAITALAGLYLGWASRKS